jgi:TolB-like protein/DNA-binding winged helix-turn-helix (wHTH) protein
MTAQRQSQAVQGFGDAFRIGSLRIDPREGEVSGPGGTETLDPKVMGVLLLLAESAGHVVSREDLMTRLWPGIIVTDDALSRCLYELRRQLASAGGSDDLRALIETLPKRGYRLNAEVTPSTAATATVTTGDGRRRWLFGALAVAIAALAVVYVAGRPPIAPPPRKTSIAVLPFTDLSETQDQGYLADGVAEEILDKLNQNTDLRVIARTSSFVFRGTDVDVAEIARKLDVTHVLEGSVRREGSSLRVTAQLIAASDSSHLWSSTFERRLGNLFAIQDEIAAAVAAALKTTIGPRQARGAPTPNFAVYDLFKQGKYLYYRRALGDVERSVELFEQAVKADPHHAKAWAELAAAYSFLAWSVDPPSELLRAKQGEAAMRAVELDPSLALAHTRLAQYYGGAGDENLMRKHADRALELDPDEPLLLGFLASEVMYAGDSDAALAYQRRALVRDPMNSVQRQNLGVALMTVGRLGEALATYRTLVEINPDVGADVEVEIPRLLVLLDRDAQAAVEAMRLPAGEIRDHALAFLHRTPIHRREADAALRRFAQHERVPGTNLSRHLVADSVRLAENYAFRGMNDEAFDVLTTRLSALAIHPEAKVHLWYLRYEMRVSPFLKPLHADPRWAELLPELSVCLNSGSASSEPNAACRARS